MARPSAAQLLGPELRVNSYTPDRQSDAAVAADGLGNFVIVWISVGPDGTGQDGSYSGIFGQRLAATGLPLGTEFQANTHTTGWQLFPDVAADDLGNFVVVWSGEGLTGGGTFGQAFDPVGTPAGSEFEIGNGGFPAAAAGGVENFLVVRENCCTQSGAEISGRRFAGAGIPLGEDFRVNAYTPGDQLEPVVTADGSGNFVVVWNSTDQDGSDLGVFGQRLDAEGSAVGPEFRVNSFTTGTQYFPSVAAADAGDFVVVWSSLGQGGEPYAVHGQRYDGAGTSRGPEFLIASMAYGPPMPAAAADGTGQFIVVWQGREGAESDWSVFARLYDPEGQPLGGRFRVSEMASPFGSSPAVAARGPGEFLAVWDSYSVPGAGADVLARRIRAPFFGDGFEAGDACRWSMAQGGGCP